MTNRLLAAALILFSCIGALLQAPTAQAQYKGINFQAVIKKPNGTYPTASGLSATLQILDPVNDCVLREEQYSGVNVSNGYINLVIGNPAAITSAARNPSPVLSLQEVFDNSVSRSGLKCVGLDNAIVNTNQTYIPADHHARRLRLRVTIDGEEVVGDFNLRAAAFATNAESLGGKTPTDFISRNPSQGVTQANLESIFSRYSALDTLLNGNLSLPSDGLVVGTNQLVVNGGKVGIGTAAPTGILDVQGGTAAAGTAGASINITAQSGGAGSANGGDIVLTAGAAAGTGTKGAVKLYGRLYQNGSINASGSAMHELNMGIGGTTTTAFGVNVDPYLSGAATANLFTSFIAITPTVGTGTLNNYVGYAMADSTVRSGYTRAAQYSVSSGTNRYNVFADGTADNYFAGKVGIGTAAPAALLDVAGNVKVGNSGAVTCDGTTAGSIRYNSGNVEYCNGTTWAAFTSSGAGITSLNGLTSNTQTFAAPGVTGTSPNWSSSGSAHTLNIPLASSGAVTAGLLSNADYTTFNNKISNAGNTPSIQSGLDAAKPSDNAPATTGRLYVSTDSKKIYRDNGWTWDILGSTSTTDAGDLSSGTLLAARLPAFTGDVTSSAGSNSLTLGTVPLTKGGTGLSAAGGANKVLGMNAAGNAAEYKSITAGTGVTVTHSAGDIQISAAGSGGTVTSVDVTVPSYMTSSGGPVTGSGAITLGFGSQTAKQVFAAPNGGNGAPTFRNLLITDVFSSIGGLSFLNTTPACSTGTALTYVSATDRIECASFTLTSSQVTTALGFTPGNATNVVAKAGDTMTGALNLPSNGLVVGTNQLVASGGNVGIGTASPNKKLHVSGGQALFGVNAPATYTYPAVIVSQNNGGFISVGSPNSGDWGGGFLMFGRDSGVSGTPGTWKDLFQVSGETFDISGGDTARYFTIKDDVANAVRFRIDTAGNVGIGTSSPARLLHVAGPMRINATALPGTPAAGDIAVDSADANKLKWYNGTAWQTVATGSSAGTVTSVDVAVPSYMTTSGGPVTGSGSITLGFGAQAAKQVFMAPSGAAGVPTFRNFEISDVFSSIGGLPFLNTTPACTSGRALTYVSATDRIECADITLTSAQVTTALGFTPTNASNFVAKAGDTMTGTLNLPANGLVLGTNQLVTSGGNVGIGTASPATKLHVAGTISAQSGDLSVLDAGGNERARFTQSAGNGYMQLYAGATLAANIVASGPSYLNGGNVGIGTATPANLLEVNKDQNTETAIYITNPSTGSDAEAGLEFSNNNGLVGGLWAASSAYSGYADRLTLSSYGTHGVNIEAQGSGDIRFYTTGSVTERMRVMNDGSVGIGTTAPRAALDVNGTLLTKPAVSNATSTVDFSTGNQQYTASNCGAFVLHNMKDGGNYTFVVKGATSSTCSFSAFSDAGGAALTVHMPPGHGATTASYHTVYSFMVLGTDLYVAWVPGY